MRKIKKSVYLDTMSVQHGLGDVFDSMSVTGCEENHRMQGESEGEVACAG